MSADRASRPPIELVVPGSIATRTGGYGYDRRVVEALRARGRAVRVHELPGGYPHPDNDARDAARDVLAALPAGAIVVVDGLAFGALPDVARTEGGRLALVALVHHPLADEGGVPDELAALLRAAERRALAAARGAIVTSPATARALAGYDVPPERIATVTPGTDPAPIAAGSADGTTSLLCVATLTPRKGHATLLDALARLPHVPWRLRCTGSDARDRETAEALRERVERLGLDERVSFDGEVDDATLAARYDAADLFVLATRHEGYGMVFDEALARALPIVASGTGAVADTVPDDAGLVVPADDVDALHAALEHWFAEPALRERLRAGARRARDGLRDWTVAGEEFERALDALVRAGR